MLCSGFGGPTRKPCSRRPGRLWKLSEAGEADSEAGEAREASLESLEGLEGLEGLGVPRYLWEVSVALLENLLSEAWQAGRSGC